MRRSDEKSRTNKTAKRPAKPPASSLSRRSCLDFCFALAHSNTTVMRPMRDFLVLLAICAGGVLRPTSAVTAFVPSSPPAAPRCYRKTRRRQHHNKQRHRPQQPSTQTGREIPIAFAKRQSSQRYRQAASALRSTVSLAETLSRNSTHDDAAATSAP